MTERQRAIEKVEKYKIIWDTSWTKPHKPKKRKVRNNE
jgi:hypothetical protein